MHKPWGRWNTCFDGSIVYFHSGCESQGLLCASRGRIRFGFVPIRSPGEPGCDEPMPPGKGRRTQIP
jgi:hypothetical protein